MDKTWAGVLWLLTRAFVLWLFFGPESWVTGDVAYFAGSLEGVSERGLAATLMEYPLPGVALVAFPWLLAQWAGHPDLYSEIVMGLALVTDAAFTVLLYRFGRAGRGEALYVWLLAVPLLGATTYARFDLVPGILAGVSVLLLASHPRVAAGAVGVATGLKFWPALLLPALAARTRERRAVLSVVAMVGLLLAGGALTLAGWARLVSPLTWQAERGLQIESVTATPAMLAWALDPGELEVAYSGYNAFEISGTGVPLLLAASNLLSLLLVVGLAVLWVRAWRRGSTLSPDAVVWLALTAIGGFMVSSKVLSPQYLMWLLPAAAAGLAVVETRRGLRRLRRWAVVLLVATGTTHLVFPVFYGGLTTPDETSIRVVLLLVARNAMLVWLLVRGATESWWHLHHESDPQPGVVLARQPPGPDGSDARTLR